MRCLEADHYMWRYSLTTLQAMVVLIYGIGHSHGQSLTLLGLAYNIALSIGCHVDPSSFELDLIECEERRRAWAGLMMLYTSQNTASGNIGPRYARLGSNTTMPADIDDDELTPWRQVPFTPPSRPTQMSYLLLKFRLYELGSDICEKVILAYQLDLDNIRYFDEAISAEQRVWDAKYLVSAESEPGYATTAHFYILSGASYQLLLLLHRSVLASEMSTTEQVQWSRSRCLDNAERLLDVLTAFHNSADLAPYRWYMRGLGSFHAFHAAIVVIAMLSSGIKTSRSEELRRKLECCKTIFEALSDLSKVCSKAASVLRQLL